ncbi:DUF6509 family protein [Halalkalibacter urbisdiaboli]|uniref:DUF6509 family protein n=1 Tax=Halalkalibacter urbisdiaboli TaxID=1960589 RepID=UPI000B43F644|nr:DUF6509 family protein [Halalkalibacter urbisdiaboli]
MEIVSHEVEKINDPTGILTGERYEFHLNVEVPEDDELFSVHGLYIRVIIADDQEVSMKQYQIYEKGTDRYLDFDLEEEELDLVQQYCYQYLAELKNS